MHLMVLTKFIAMENDGVRCQPFAVVVAVGLCPAVPIEPSIRGIGGGALVRSWRIEISIKVVAPLLVTRIVW